MPTIQDTAYPRMSVTVSERELREVYTPTDAELELAARSTTGAVARVAFLCLFKTVERLGYPLPLTALPPAIVAHIAHVVGHTVTMSDLIGYDASGTRRRHLTRVIVAFDALWVLAYIHVSEHLFTGYRGLGKVRTVYRVNSVDCSYFPQTPIMSLPLQARFEPPALSAERDAMLTTYTSCDPYAVARMTFFLSVKGALQLDIQPIKRRPRRWASLVAGILFIALAVAAVILIPPAIDTHHVTVEPTPGQISLPPTATPGNS